MGIKGIGNERQAENISNRANNQQGFAAQAIN